MKLSDLIAEVTALDTAVTSVGTTAADAVAKDSAAKDADTLAATTAANAQALLAQVKADLDTYVNPPAPVVPVPSGPASSGAMPVVSQGVFFGPGGLFTPTPKPVDPNAPPAPVVPASHPVLDFLHGVAVQLKPVIQPLIAKFGPLLLSFLLPMLATNPTTSPSQTA